MVTLSRCLVAGLLAFASPTAAQQAPPPPTRLYALDCGRLDYPDMNGFSDTDDYAGQPGYLVVPCYLIRHGDEWLLWDTGVGDRIAALPDGEVKQGGRFTLRRTLASQLTELGLTPDDVRYVGLSHLHADHAGNVGLFPRAIFLVPASELAWARGRPTPEGVEAAMIAPLEQSRVEASDDDRDVFGDGSVRILKAQGHTPGHRMLLVTLPGAGRLLITGDLYHRRESLERGFVPRVNVDRADTLASFHRFAALRSATGARVVVQHAPEDFAALPAFPEFLD